MHLQVACVPTPINDDAALDSILTLDAGVPAVKQQHSAPPVLPSLSGGGAEGIVGASGVRASQVGASAVRRPL